MTKSTTVISKTQKKKPGPPATGKGAPILVRLQPPDLARLDDWIFAQADPKPTRPEAVRRLVEKGLGETETASTIAPSELNASNDE